MLALSDPKSKGTGIVVLFRGPLDFGRRQRESAYKMIDGGFNFFLVPNVQKLRQVLSEAVFLYLSLILS